MAQLAFPTSPQIGDKFSSGAWSWRWDGDKWVSGGAEALSDAPSDDRLWARRNGVWSPVNIPDIPEDASIIASSGRLDVVIGGRPAPSSNDVSDQIGYFPYNGAWMRIDGKDYSLSANGVIANGSNAIIDGVPGQNLAVNTVYLVYLFVDNGGHLAIEFSQTPHVISTTSGNAGIEVKQGDESRSLIGIVLTSASTSTHFRDNITERWLASWLNPQRRAVWFSRVLGFSNTTLQPLDSFQFVNFAGDWWGMTFGGLHAPNQPNINLSIGMNPNGLQNFISTVRNVQAGVAVTAAVACAHWLPEGRTTIYLVGNCSADWLTGNAWISGLCP